MAQSSYLHVTGEETEPQSVTVIWQVAARNARLSEGAPLAQARIWQEEAQRWRAAWPTGRAAREQGQRQSPRFRSLAGSTRTTLPLVWAFLLWILL